MKISTKFIKQVKSETFSFISLSMSIVALLANYFSKFIPMYNMYYDPSGVLVQSTEVSTEYVVFTLVCIVLLVASLFLFLRKK